MNLLHLITSIIVWTAFYAAAENDPRNYDLSREKRHGLIGADYYQPSYTNYPSNNNNYYSQPSQSNYYPSQQKYYSPSRSDYYYRSPSYQSRPSSNYYYYPQRPVLPSSPISAIKSIISRQDGPIGAFGYKNPNYGPTDRPRKKKKKLFVPNVWG